MSFPPLGRDDTFLAPGDFYAGFAPARVWTILGSCISLVLWHPGLQFGVMSHYLLPGRAHSAAKRRGNLDARYGAESCALALAAMERACTEPNQFHARLFGGGQMFVGESVDRGAAVGRRNAEVAYEFLHKHGIRLIGESLYGLGHRRICFDVATGEVLQQHTRIASPERKTKAKRVTA